MPPVIFIKKKQANPVSSLSFLASASAYGASITVPSNVQEDDILVLFQLSQNNVIAEVLPAGFQSLITITSTIGTIPGRHSISAKIADGSEASSALMGMDDSFDYKGLLVFRPDGRVGVLTGASTVSIVTAGDPSPLAITSSDATPPFIVFANYSEDSTLFTSGNSFVPTEDDMVPFPDSGYATFWAAYKIYNEEGSTGVSIDMTDHGDCNALFGVILQVASS